MSVSVVEQVKAPIVLECGGACVVVDVTGGVPRVLHWGRSIEGVHHDGSFHETLLDSQRWSDGLTGAHRLPAILPEQSDAWIGLPGLEGHRDGTDFTTSFCHTGCELSGDATAGWQLTVSGEDESAGLALVTILQLSPAGVVQVRATLTNIGSVGSYTLNAARLVLPVPIEAQELLDFSGRHLRERTPQRHPFSIGTHLREGRRGRTGSDATLVLAAGTSGFGFRHGEVWAVHTAWSGNHATFAELELTGVRVLGGGEVLLPGEVRLEPGESYTTPSLFGAYGQGLDAISAVFHRHLRRRAGHPATFRPVILNTWEAVYFDHDLDSLTHLADLAAKIGVERFVLDDGWFLGRRDARRGLGDWAVDPDVWPKGLAPLVAAVRERGMDFGLWFEPEMINEDSELARAHPEWILGPGDRLPLAGRHQQVLNLTLPGAYDHVLTAMSSLIDQHDIDYIKWDHNRDLIEPGNRTTREPRVHEQTLAVYQLMDELRRRHPRLEIESCSSGGGRIDLEVLKRTDRVWASDCIDAVERQRIQRWTGMLLPPELVGSHVGATTAHTTRRTHSLSFRAATALFGHFGIEWDLRTASDSELEELTAWVALYKEVRELLHTGVTVRCDYPDEALWAHGIVAENRRSALFSLVGMNTSPAAQPGRIRIPGLSPEVQYRIQPVQLSEGALTKTAGGPPSWWVSPPRATGRALEAVGLQGPMIDPEQALLFRLSAEEPTNEGR